MFSTIWIFSLEHSGAWFVPGSAAEAGGGPGWGGAPGPSHSSMWGSSNAYQVPGTVLGTGDTTAKEAAECPELARVEGAPRAQDEGGGC